MQEKGLLTDARKGLICYINFLFEGSEPDNCHFVTVDSENWALIWRVGLLVLLCIAR